MSVFIGGQGAIVALFEMRPVPIGNNVSLNYNQVGSNVNVIINKVKRFIGIFLLVLCSSFTISCEKEEDFVINPDSVVGEDVKSEYKNGDGDGNETKENGKDNVDDEDEVTSNNEDILLGISKYMNQSSSGTSVQGADCYGDYLFQFQHANAAVYVYNLKEKVFVGKIALKPNSNNHCNNVSFSNRFYEDGDEFPLLYVSGSQSGTYNQVQVYRIFRNDDVFSIEQVQTIKMPKGNEKNHMFWTQVMIDKDENVMYVLSKTQSSGGTFISKLNIPYVYREDVELSEDDIIDQFEVENSIHKQGAVARKGFLYIMYGVPGYGDTVYLRIVDLKNRKDACAINLTEEGFKVEPEGSFFYNSELYCATNNSGIFKLELDMDYLTGIVPIYYDKP